MLMNPHLICILTGIPNTIVVGIFLIRISFSWTVIFSIWNSIPIRILTSIPNSIAINIFLVGISLWWTIVSCIRNSITISISSCSWRNFSCWSYRWRCCCCCTWWREALLISCDTWTKPFTSVEEALYNTFWCTISSIYKKYVFFQKPIFTIFRFEV